MPQFRCSICSEETDDTNHRCKQARGEILPSGANESEDNISPIRQPNSREKGRSISGVHNAESLLPQIAEPLIKKKEGFRHLWLGDSGMGKTWANRILIDWLIRSKLTDLVLTVDDKSRWQAQFKGTYRANPSHLRREPPRDNESHIHIVFRGVALTRSLHDGIEHEHVASMAWECIRLRQANVVINLDELADATNGHQDWQGQSIAEVYRKGRGVGLSIVASTQLPQLLPRESFGLSETIAIFRMTSREAKYLVDYKIIDKAHVDVITSLQVGEFLFWRKAVPFTPIRFRFGRS